MMRSYPSRSISWTARRKTRSHSSYGIAQLACTCSFTFKDGVRGKSRAGREDVYGDALAEHDGHVGQLLSKLEATGLDKNTIVVYVTDNGAYQYMWPEGGTSPFRGDKGTTWEGGVRAPCMVRWPGATGGAFLVRLSI
jgi:membrane-anchored protein YejM (alkaline phosphatase superfamily)